MTNRLDLLENWAAGLLRQLEPASRKKLARSVGQTLRRSQQQRVNAQRNPNGSIYAPRKQRNLQEKKGRVKRKGKMFKKLRTVSFMRTCYDGNSVYVGFTGRAARIARIHQYGLEDRSEKGAPNVIYKQRELLGLTEDEMNNIRNYLLDKLIKKL